MKKLCMILPLTLILCFMVGCQDKEAMAELEAMKAKAEVEEQNKELVRHEFELWDKGDFDALEEVLAPEHVTYSPSANLKPLYLEDSKELGRMIFKAFPDSSFTIKELFATGDRVVTRWIYRGTHEGEFMGIPPTGKKVEFGGITIARIENGKNVETWEDYDMLGWMQQLGMELKPKEGE
jgi:steroid delta-isomerase-like uncharacterized protein